MKGYHVIDVYGRKTHQVKRSKATPMTIKKNGFCIELPENCFNKTTGRMKISVLKNVIGNLSDDKLAFLRAKGAIINKIKEVENYG